MASKQQLERELIEYANLKDNLSKTASNLSSAATSAYKINPSITQHYTVDRDSSQVTERTDKLAFKITETSNYVSNTIIPAIDSKMDSIRAEIRRIEEEEARRAREEAERAEAARKASSIRFRW